MTAFQNKQPSVERIDFLQWTPDKRSVVLPFFHHAPILMKWKNRRVLMRLYHKRPAEYLTGVETLRRRHFQFRKDRAIDSLIGLRRIMPAALIQIADGRRVDVLFIQPPEGEYLGVAEQRKDHEPFAIPFLLQAHFPEQWFHAFTLNLCSQSDVGPGEWPYAPRIWPRAAAARAA